MVSLDVTIVNELGLHARAAAKVVRESNRFACNVWISKGRNRVNGKSIMGILTLAAARGELISIETDGADEQQAAEALAALVREGFGEAGGTEKGEKRL